MRRGRLALAGLVFIVLAVPAAAAAGVKLRGTDATAYPTMRASVVSPAGARVPPTISENGTPVAGLQAQNLGRAKAIALVVDRSQSMRGKPLVNASAGARAFVGAKQAADEFSVVAFGSRASTLSPFSILKSDADAALARLKTDKVQGTALYDAIVVAARQLGANELPGRVLIVLTDGADKGSKHDLSAAIAAAHQANAAVYTIGIEGTGFTSDPLVELSSSTGGQYYGASSTSDLAAVYGTIAEVLKRTWRIQYVTAARPGDRITLTASVIGEGSDAEVVAIPRGKTPGLAEPSKLNAKQKRKERRGEMTAALFRGTEHAFGHLKQWRWIGRMLERADVPLKTVEFFWIVVGSAVGVGMFALAFGAGPVVLLILMVVAGSIPFSWVWLKMRKRLRAFENQLPDLLITIAASLKAGHSFKQGLQAVVDEGHPPANEEIKRVLTETSLGRPMDDALAEMAERVGSKNFEFAITAVTIQRQVGGSLATLFDMVADTVRQRQQFARKIRALTAMGRMSAYTLIGIPFFLAGTITVLNSDFMSPLYHTHAGHMLILLGLTMMMIGSLILKKIVSFRG